MKRLLVFALILSFTFPVFAQKLEKPSTSSNQIGQLPVKRVILYSHGVGYFERKGLVSGSENIELEFNTKQMNDVLKSLLVLDLNGGRISTVNYDSSKPLDKQLEDFSLSLTDSNQRGMSALIAQMRGAKVEVRAKEIVIGKVVGLEKKRITQNQNILEQDLLVIATDLGDIRAFDLVEIRGIKILDQKLRNDLEHYLDILNNTHKKDARNITISAQGEGQRNIVAGYTIEAPVWKTTYRVVIDSKGKPFLQGWAIVDNEQNEDWENVELSLVSGKPVSFTQNIQAIKYRVRPEVPLPEDNEPPLKPQIYEEAIDKNNPEPEEEGYEGGVEGGVAGGVAGGVIGGVMGGSGPGNPYVPPPPPRPLTENLESSTSSVAVGRNIGELFEYKVDHPVTIKRNSSALIPIISTKIEGERIAIFNEDNDIRNPMSGVLIHNTTNLTLENGPLTVFEQETYAGESLISRMKPDEKRFLTYAADLSCFISVSNEDKVDNVSSVSINKGTFVAYNKQISTKTYNIVNKDNKQKVIYLEHPFKRNWKLVNTPEPAEQTQNYFRFRVTVEPKTTLKFPVVEENTLETTYYISRFTPEDIEFFFKGKHINDEIKQALEQILATKNKIYEIDQELATKNRQISEINSEQARLRTNLETISKTADDKTLLNRYIQKFKTGEDEIERLQAEIKKITADRANLYTEMNKQIEAISFNVKK
ncbi:MAG: hypothetical protein WAQ98_07295 [Blastocatellia bacterium]